MLERLMSFVIAVAIMFGFIWLVRITEKPWPLIEGQSLVNQVGACQLINMRTGAENYLQAMKIFGMHLDLETGVDLAINGPPSFGRRYDCFANLSSADVEAVISTKQYRDVQFEIARQIGALSKPVRGF
jgi:hypothetical protein